MNPHIKNGEQNIHNVKGCIGDQKDGGPGFPSSRDLEPFTIMERSKSTPSGRSSNLMGQGLSKHTRSRSGGVDDLAQESIWLKKR